jgi:SAM-dependent methyltransferase
MSDASAYDAQHRGASGAYESYYAGMDRTMRQKLAFVGAHFLLDPGAHVADMGCGSGSGAYQLALLNPAIEVIGVDINPESIRLASEKYRLPNLRFIVGDAAEPVFVDDPLDGILSSSTLHHVYTFSGYSRDAVRRAIASHLACLRHGGIFVLRDFVSPARGAYVLLELPDQPSKSDAIADLSDADLLVRFAETARPLDKRSGPGFFLEELEARNSGTRLFRVAHKWAAEFVLRKDYRRDWDVELLEEYSYFTADEFVEELRAAGGRLLCAEPYSNPWIVKHRFEGKFRLLDENGQPLGWPPTNFVAVTQRVQNGASVRLGERRTAPSKPSFLVMESMRDTSLAAAPVYDLIRRPNPVCDFIPWRLDKGRLRITARHGYPRPITCAVPRGPTMIDGSRWGGYLVEPLTGMVPDHAAPADIAAILGERAGIDASMLGALTPALTYYPSPGGIDEIVTSLFIEAVAPLPHHPLSTALSGFSTAGEVREFDAQDLLRAAHVGVLPEARLEMNLYALMQRLGIVPDPFIGEEIEASRDLPSAKVRRADLDELLARPAVSPYQPADKPNGYLRLIRSVFADQTEEEGLPRTLAEQELEFVLPREQSCNTIVALPLLQREEALVGLETRQLPVPQTHDGNARILTAPAWRLGREIQTLDQARLLIGASFGVPDSAVLPLGAAYFPSAGITPERVYPFVVRVAGTTADLPYDFVSVDQVRDNLHRLRDGHLLIAAMRLIHAFGMWKGGAAKVGDRS